MERCPASSEDHSETSVVGGKILEGSSSLTEGDRLVCQEILCLCPGHKLNDMMEKLFRREFLRPEISPIPFPPSPQRLAATTLTPKASLTLPPASPYVTSLKLSLHSVFTNIFRGFFCLSDSISVSFDDPSLLPFQNYG